jgi:hypothetical protein
VDRLQRRPRRVSRWQARRTHRRRGGARLHRRLATSVRLAGSAVGGYDSRARAL